MPVYVDPLSDFGWHIGGKHTLNCHLFTDELNLDALHAVAAAAGMKREWFQDKWRAPHYDLTPMRRDLAIKAGALIVDRRRAVAIWRARRKALELAKKAPVSTFSPNGN